VVSGGPIASLAAGASDSTTFTAIHTITQADIDARIVYNLATATGTPPKGPKVTGTSTDPTPCTTCVVDPTCIPCTITVLPENPSVKITKDGTYVDVNNDGKTNIGDVVKYNFVVTNAGDVTLTNVTVTDNNAVVSGGPIASLAAGASDSTTFTAIHTITQADIDARIVYNLATATGTPPKGPKVTGTSTDPTPCTTCVVDPTCIPCTITVLDHNPGLIVIKTANTTSYSSVGEVIIYTIQVKNTGNVTINTIVVTDPLTGLNSIISLLEPGFSKEFIQNYTITESDLFKDSVVNIAYANGFTPDNKPIGASGSVEIDKSIVLGCGTITVHNAFSPNGDRINETFLIDNIGDTNCYPDNTVEIYNRWGVLVFETKGYDNVNKVFRGYSEGRTTITQSTSLPTGTYFYILNYTSFDGNNKIITNKKDGFLYLTK
jgi:gliding motility-associated-like protein/uncharacterized repeat protein (TIGR01451 family)